MLIIVLSYQEFVLAQRLCPRFGVASSYSLTSWSSAIDFLRHVYRVTPASAFCYRFLRYEYYVTVTSSFFLQLDINYKLYPDYLAASNAPAPSGSSTTTTSSSSSSSSDTGGEAAAILSDINNLYIGAGVIHFVNAFQYYHSWLPSGFRWYSVVMIPEYLNMLGAGIYMYTATLYPECGEYESEVTLRVHKLETAAAVIEVFAALGWFTTWYLTFPRKAGRGWTLDDPDLWGNVLIIAPSIVYLVYNVNILQDPTQYGTDLLYEKGDLIYAIGAFLYLACALRDDGWLFFMPEAGRLPGGWGAKPPIPPPMDSDSFESDVSHGSLLEYTCGSCFGCACDCCTPAEEILLTPSSSLLR